MKVRLGFVSNSSSCSFVIKREILTNDKLQQIKDFVNCGKLEKCKTASTRCPGCRDDFWEFNDGGWGIQQSEESILFETGMANFDLYSYITRVLEINPRDISVLDDTGIDLEEYYATRTFEQARKDDAEELNDLLNILKEKKKDT
ncbi:MAG: hypothetical protein LBK83_05315 [Treponema sp.]|jgi:hypothetical protein|nr:hypothetical protein [Treponema sp.]